MPTIRTLATAAVAVVALAFPVTAATTAAAAVTVNDGPTVAVPHPIDEARALYHGYLYTDGCEADFRAIYVGLVVDEAVDEEAITAPSYTWPGMSHLYTDGEHSPGC